MPAHSCQCKKLGKYKIVTDYADLNVDTEVVADKMTAPGGIVYYRVFHDPSDKNIFYNVPEHRVLEMSKYE